MFAFVLPFELFVAFAFEFFAGSADKVAVGVWFFKLLPDLSEVAAWVFAPVSVKPPASASTHIPPYWGCGPHEIPATL